MKTIFYSICLTLGLIFSFALNEADAQNIPHSKMKAALIYKFTSNIEWTNEQQIDTFKIGFLGNEEDFLLELKSLEKIKINNKPVFIIHFSSVNAITKTQVMVTSNDKNSEFEEVLRKTIGNSTLLISDRLKNQKIIMINFIYRENDKIDFEINNQNITNEGMIVLPKLLLIGGTKVDVAELYKSSQQSLQDITKKVSQLEIELEKKKSEIAKINKEINKQKSEIKQQKSEIKKQNVNIVQQQGKISIQEEKLAFNFVELEKQQKLLKGKLKKLLEYQEEVDAQKGVLNNLKSEILDKQQKIEIQNSELDSFEKKVETQQSILYIIVAFLLFMLVLAFFIYRSYKIKKDANKKVTLINEALERQKEELQLALENLKAAQSQLIMTEKMASLGQLTAGIAHELNNPVNFVKSNIRPLKNDLDDIFNILDKYDSIIKEKKLDEDFKEVDTIKNEIEYSVVIKEIDNLFEGIIDGANRSIEIVKGLRSFSRMDEEEFKKVDIHEGIDSTLILLRNKMKENITVHKEYAESPLVDCLPGKLNQVFMNILNNGIQAIEGEGDIFIKTSFDNKYIYVSIKDTGVGMSEEVKNRIFEPFFTTKDVGNGTGLGLSISYGIIEKHNGTINVNTIQGKGTEFIIIIPFIHND